EAGWGGGLLLREEVPDRCGKRGFGPGRDRGPRALQEERDDPRGKTQPDQGVSLTEWRALVGGHRVRQPGCRGSPSQRATSHRLYQSHGIRLLTPTGHKAAVWPRQAVIGSTASSG